MKSAVLVQIFPVDKERAKKMCQDGGVEFINASLKHLIQSYEILPMITCVF